LSDLKPNKINKTFKFLEAGTGIEPVYSDLQSSRKVNRIKGP
jgi:ribosomal protein L20A (L18A)